MLTTDARVVGVRRGRYDVQTPAGILSCRLPGRLTKTRSGERTLIVVGDRVAFTDNGDGTGNIAAILPRSTAVSRRAPGTVPRQHVLAANVDTAAVVVALLEPRFKPGTVSQLLTGAKTGGADPLVILNKVDLGARSSAVAALEPFRQAGVPYVLTSAVTGQGIPELAGLLQDRWTLFFGQSGVGKSSLLNALCPGAGARISEISSATHWGRHTTTGSRLYHLPQGGYVIDTPGVRTFTFWSAPEQDELDDLFPEIAELARGCKFTDCTHTHEPSCTVKAALDSGEIDPGRYKHFVRLSRSSRMRTGR